MFRKIENQHSKIKKKHFEHVFIREKNKTFNGSNDYTMPIANRPLGRFCIV